MAQLLTFCDNSEYTVPIDHSFETSGYAQSNYMVICNTCGNGVTKLPFKSFEEAEMYVNSLDKRITEFRILSRYGLIFRLHETILIIENAKDRVHFIKNEKNGTYKLKLKYAKQCIETI